ncbi:MAG: hypothetical protein KGL35_09600 [Bradyrhizobium sp.]|nr:hypothetical protein [Bradyrhizobium sp.]
MVDDLIMHKMSPWARNQNTFRDGDWNTICDRTGFKIKASDGAFEWNGGFVRGKSYEERHPQDFVRGVPDMQRAPFARPDINNELFVDAGSVSTYYYLGF